MAAINSPDEAAAWAHRNLPAKNTLTAADAKIVEERFQARLLQIDQEVTATETPPADPTRARMPDARAPRSPPHNLPTQTHASADVVVTPDTQKAAAIGRKRSPSSSVHALGKPVRLRDKEHRKFVSRQALPCLRPDAVGSSSPHVYATSCPRT